MKHRGGPGRAALESRRPGTSCKPPATGSLDPASCLPSAAGPEPRLLAAARPSSLPLAPSESRLSRLTSGLHHHLRTSSLNGPYSLPSAVLCLYLTFGRGAEPRARASDPRLAPWVQRVPGGACVASVTPLSPASALAAEDGPQNWPQAQCDGPNEGLRASSDAWKFRDDSNGRPRGKSLQKGAPGPRTSTSDKPRQLSSKVLYSEEGTRAQ